MLETFIFQLLYARYLYSIQIHKQIIEVGAALVNTISSYKEWCLRVFPRESNRKQPKQTPKRNIFSAGRIDQFLYTKIRLKTIDLSTQLCICSQGPRTEV